MLNQSLFSQGTPSGKRYKFVVTGHGKYEKIPVDENGDEYTNANGKSGEKSCFKGSHSWL